MAPTDEQPPAVLDALGESDLAAVTTLLETWVRDFLRVVDGEVRGVVARDELNADLARIKGSLAGENAFRFFVLRSEGGEVLGMAGLGPLEERLKTFASTGNPAVMVNVFLNPRQRGRGLGLALVRAVLRKAAELGYTEVLWHSGPRYATTAWDFYNRHFGPPVAVVPGFYGGKWDARVWRVVL